MEAVHLSDFDFRAIRVLRDAGVLEDVNGNSLNPRNGSVVFSCSDGDQLYHLLSRIWKALKDALYPKRRTHLFACHGGSAILGYNSPLNFGFKDVDKFYFFEIQESFRIKNMHTLALTIHTPCAGAYGTNQSIFDLITLMMQGKDRVKEQDRLARVACFVQVDYGKHRNGKNRKRLYFISKKKWTEWSEVHRVTFEATYGSPIVPT